MGFGVGVGVDVGVGEGVLVGSLVSMTLSVEDSVVLPVLSHALNTATDIETTNTAETIVFNNLSNLLFITTISTFLCLLKQYDYIKLL